MPVIELQWLRLAEFILVSVLPEVPALYVTANRAAMYGLYIMQFSPTSLARNYPYSWKQIY